MSAIQRFVQDPRGARYIEMARAAAREVWLHCVVGTDTVRVQLQQSHGCAERVDTRCRHCTWRNMRPPMPRSATTRVRLSLTHNLLKA